MIIEAIITTMDEAGLVNFAPMGVESRSPMTQPARSVT